MSAPEEKWLAHSGGLPTGNYPKDQLVRYIRADIHAARIADLERQLAEAREVKPLEWKPRKNFNGDWVAKTPWGQYSVGCIHGEWWWFFEHLQDGIDKTAKGRRGTERGAKSAAFADHKRRIHSTLKGPTP